MRPWLSVWSEVDFDAGTVQITSTLVRVKGEGLLRKGTKSRAGERTLPLPESAVAMLRRRFMTGARLDQPLFPDVHRRLPRPGQRAARAARGEGDGDPRVDHVAQLPEDGGDDPRRGRACRLAWSRTSSGTVGHR